MSAINTIPCPRAFAEEHPCGEMTPDGLLCRRCESRLRHALKELPTLWQHLQVTLTRQAKTETGGKRGTEEPLPFSFDASWDSDAVIMTITTWIRDIQETYGVTTDPGTTMTSWCLWLLEQMHHIRNHPAVEQLWDELTEPGRVIKRTIDRPADLVFVCPCALCGHQVFAPEGVDEVECKECRRVVGDTGYVPTYSKAEEEQRKKELMRQEVVPAHDLREAISYVEGIRVNRKTLHSWIARNRLKANQCQAYAWVGDHLVPTWKRRRVRRRKRVNGQPVGYYEDLVVHVPLYLVEDAVKLARDIPLRDLRGDDTEEDRVEIDHKAAYAKVLRVIQGAGGAA